ncbi:hypothetical protein [Streptomyces sp. WAC08241]|uniref:hypothetical protein n=1 Tax=Streptomyces sp. WAC08241 TaxID=2487421 RepID=UPI00163C2749|nr:hypothetical protein [Streptomyces sp. WAC08241]
MGGRHICASFETYTAVAVGGRVAEAATTPPPFRIGGRLPVTGRVRSYSAGPAGTEAP